MDLPSWLLPLPDAAGQRGLDEWAIAQRRIPGLELMERAAAGLAARVLELVPEGPLAVVCGRGNNGGDGLAAARLLREQGRTVRVLLLAEPDAYRGDALANLERLPDGLAESFTATRLSGAAAIVDAVLGTGFSGEPREPALTAIDAMNAASEAGTRVIACDVPSGVDASTGVAPGAAVQADATVTFNAAKPGLWISPGKGFAGELTVVDIGIPADGAPLSTGFGLIGADVLAEVPRRGSASNKFSSGAVLIYGGSHGLTGAPSLSALAASRAGAGYVTVAVPESIAPVLQIKLLEQMVFALPEQDGALAPGARDRLIERSQRVGSVVIGPGLGREPAMPALVRGLAEQIEKPLVIDADGLHALIGRDESLRNRTAGTVLTPHEGELARLLEIDSSAVSAERLRSARTVAERSGAIVVLKGDDTLVVAPDGRVAISPGGAPALATAGTGDVLSGVVGAYLAKQMDPFTAACAAVEAHRRAGVLAGLDVGTEGVVAGDVVALLPQVFLEDEVG
jgi:NAD(P)H-hydrate epimerase